MTLTQLTYIVALAEHGHFGRAAEACFVSQPTLSMQLQKLEQELGVLLFDRSVQPVRPTGRGRQVVAQARVILAERDRLLALLREAGPLAGELRVGIIPTLATYLLPIIAPVLQERHPGVALTVEEVTTTHLMERLAAGRLDAGLIATEEEQAGIERVPLFREAFVGYAGDGAAPAAERLCVADLAEAELWLLTEGHCLRDQVLQLCRHAHRPTARGVHFESGNLETLRHLVDRVGGMTLLPWLATYYLDADARRRVRRFEPPAPDRAVHLVRPRAGVKQRLTDALAQVVRETVRPLLERAAS